MEVALYLAPNHRYVCRSAARFFLHTRDEDRARYVIAKNPALLKDPWLLASEIAINTLMERTSRNIIKGSELIKSNNYSPFSLSELSSAIGSIEMKNGNRKKCRSYFKTALQNPNDNSLAQAQFLMSKHSDLTFEFGDNIAIPNAFEADAITSYISGEYNKSLISAVDWINDMPFTRRPVQFAANIAFSFLKDYDTAINILDLGLKANPNNAMLLNNKAYACALGGRTEDADSVIQDAKREQMTFNTKVCLTATEGLNEYRKGNHENGKRLYLQAIKMAKEYLSDTNILNTAILNFTREEARFNNSFDKSLLEIVDNIPIDSRETLQLKEDIKSVIKL
jgi:tetratricopeptide (TPR) repeat protein